MSKAPSLLGALPAVITTDLRRVLRDRFILGLVAYLLAIAILMRWAVPWVTAELATRISFDFVPYEPLLVSHIVIQLSPMIVGMVAGYLLLETKESGALLALRTTPLGVARYLRWITIGMALATALLCVIEAAIIGHASPHLGVVFLGGVLGTPMALLTAYLVGGLADTKTEAFAYSKVTAIVPLLPSGGWFVPEPFQWLFGLDPAYWASKIWWQAHAGESWLWQAGVGVAASFAATWILYRLLVRRLER